MKKIEKIEGIFSSLVIFVFFCSNFSFATNEEVVCNQIQAHMLQLFTDIRNHTLNGMGLNFTGLERVLSQEVFRLDRRDEIPGRDLAVGDVLPSLEVSSSMVVEAQNLLQENGGRLLGTERSYFGANFGVFRNRNGDVLPYILVQEREVTDQALARSIVLLDFWRERRNALTEIPGNNRNSAAEMAFREMRFPRMILEAEFRVSIRAIREEIAADTSSNSPTTHVNAILRSYYNQPIQYAPELAIFFAKMTLLPIASAMINLRTLSWHIDCAKSFYETELNFTNRSRVVGAVLRFLQSSGERNTLQQKIQDLIEAKDSVEKTIDHYMELYSQALFETTWAAVDTLRAVNGSGLITVPRRRLHPTTIIHEIDILGAPTRRSFPNFDNNLENRRLVARHALTAEHCVRELEQRWFGFLHDRDFRLPTPEPPIEERGWHREIRYQVDN